MTRLQLARSGVILVALVAASLAAAAGADEPTVLRGHVLLPDGKPAAGAGLYWVHFKAPPPRKREDVLFEKRAVADDEGRFELSLRENDAPIYPTAVGMAHWPLLAYKPGYGADWVYFVPDQVPDDAVLRLVEDRPIRGRVTDTEGRHIAGAKVAVTMISASPSGNLDDFLTDWWKQSNPRGKLEPSLYASFLPLLTTLTTVTDKDGRFELSGIGTERVASVNISAAGLVSDELWVINRDGFDAEKYNKAAQANMLPQMRRLGMFPRLTGPVFDHVAETELVVRGTVFTGRDRQPVARALVGSSGAGVRIGTGNNPIDAQTDETGRFELRGLRRSHDAGLGVYGPPGGNLLFRSVRLELTPGQTIVDVDVEMKEGVVVEGRLFDQATGRRVKGSVQFVPLPGNQYADDPGYGWSKFLRTGSKQTDDDGRFRILAIPGPGVLTARGVQIGRPGIDGNKPMTYRQASFSEEDSKRVPTIGDDDDRYFAGADDTRQSLTMQNAVKVLDLAPDGGPVTCDLPLDPGKTATIAIEDEQGQPLTDAVVSGVADTGPITFKIAAATCTIYGLGADRPRHVCILHARRHLAASLTLTGGEPGPVTVRLRPTASIAGRALDPDGEPLADAVVQIGYQRRAARELFWFLQRDQAPLKTDAEGRFRVENVLPGERLTLSFQQGDKFFGGPRITSENRQLGPGEQLELGDLKMKALN